MPELNRTKRAAKVAAVMHEALLASHRGAARWPGFNTEATACIALYGNDCYAGDSNADRQARTRAYVHGLYAGWSNLLPEGEIEFGTTDDGYSWAILLHLPRRSGRKAGTLRLLHDLVWDLWQANLSFHDCTAGKGGAT
jgi:hypothetical protein